ncbi:MAG: tetratricopeptide repeat protein [Myxococcota bacterium]
MDASSRSPDWLVRLESGRLVSFRELTTLQKWIVEGRIGRDDAISRDGRTWKRLGSIGELDSFFTVYERAKRRRQGTATDGEAPPRSISNSTSVARMAAIRALPRRASSSDAGAKTPLHRPTPTSSPSQLPRPKAPPGLTRSEPSALPPRVPRAPSNVQGPPRPGISGVYGAGLAVPRRASAPPGQGPAAGLPPEPSLSPAPIPELSHSGEPLAHALRSPAVAPAAFPSALPADPAFTGHLSFVGPAPPARTPTQVRLLGALALLAAMLLGVVVGLALARVGLTGLGVGTPYDPVPQVTQARAAMALDTPSGRSRAKQLLKLASEAAPEHPQVLLAEAELLLRAAGSEFRQADEDEAESERLDGELETWRSTIRASRGLGGRASLPPRPEVADPELFRRQARVTRERAGRKLDRAEKVLDQAAQAKADPEELYLPQARLALARGDLQTAEQLLGRVDPGRGEQAFLRSRLSAARGDKDAQIAALRRTVELDAAHLRARVELAELDIEAGRVSQASRLLSRVLEDAPDHLQAQALQARLEKRTVKVERKRTPKTRTRSYDEWMALGARADEARRADRALNAYSRATALAPIRADGHLGRADALRRLGRTEAAADAYRRFLFLARADHPERTRVKSALDALRAAEVTTTTATVAER